MKEIEAAIIALKRAKKPNNTPLNHTVVCQCGWVGVVSDLRSNFENGWFDRCPCCGISGNKIKFKNE